MPPLPIDDTPPPIGLLDAQKPPLEIGTVQLGEDGNLIPGKKWDAFEFGFFYQKCAFGVTACRQGNLLRIKLCAYLGLVPYSAQSANARRELLLILDTIPKHLHFRFEITNTQQIFFLAEPMLDLPHTPIRILAAITGLLDEAGPYFDRLLPNFYGKAA